MANFLLRGAPFLLAFALTAGLTAAAIRICYKHGWTARPRPDRWHSGTPAFFGGIPIFLGFLSATTIFLRAGQLGLWKLVAACSLIFLLGLADDVWHLQARSKLVAQFAVATLLLLSGISYPLSGNATVNFCFSLLWIVALTNAFNLLDNMDGLSPGIALIASGALLILLSNHGGQGCALLLLVTAGSVAGFLLFNSHPARIFMGDSGSLFLGFLLGTASLLACAHHPPAPGRILVPALVMAVPIMDTVFVTMTRILRGQSIFQGGTDHSSHRLVRLGISEPGAVRLLYGLSAGSGALAIVAERLPYPSGIGLAGIWLLCLFTLGVYLFHSEATAGLAKRRARLIPFPGSDSRESPQLVLPKTGNPTGVPELMHIPGREIAKHTGAEVRRVHPASR